ncbi:hypothetical protein BJX62DRAFT_230692 [Aspergillus germanicus]
MALFSLSCAIDIARYSYCADGSGTPCVFQWSPPDLILRISLNPGEVIEAPVTELQDPASHGEAGVGALVTVPGGVARGRNPQWAWGTKTDHQGQYRLGPPGPKITLTAGPRFRFTANQNKNRRRFLLFHPSTRVPGAPILTVTLHAGDATITGRNWDIEVIVKTKVTYEGVLGAETAGPIMFHAGVLSRYEAGLLLESRNGGAWELFRRYWIDTVDISDGDPWDFPSDVAHGPEDLAAVLDSFSVVRENSVAYPTDLGGRPRLVVPASDAIELEYQNRD